MPKVEAPGHPGHPPPLSDAVVKSWTCPRDNFFPPTGVQALRWTSILSGRNKQYSSLLHAKEFFLTLSYSVYKKTKCNVLLNFALVGGWNRLVGLFRSDLFGSPFLRLEYYLLKTEFLRAFDHIHNYANLRVISNKIIKLLLFFLT